MPSFAEIPPGAHLQLYADCRPVRGAVRSAVYDLTRNELVFFPTAYFDVLQYLTGGPLAPLLEDLESGEEKEAVEDFIRYLQQNDLVHFVKDSSLFPPLEEAWEVPACIQNALIDVDAVCPDFEALFRQLDELGCPYVQIRCFSNLLGPEDLRRLLASAKHRSIQSVELLLPYDAALPDETLVQLVEDEPIICGLTVHSAPEERLLTVDYGCDEVAGRYITKAIPFITQAIDTHRHCGLMSEKHLNAPTVANFFEAQKFNGCLNRKIAVDVFGEIKNCPSMAHSFGNIRDTELRQAVGQEAFRRSWTMAKDSIRTCRDCEFRYACSDCRAYVEDPSDPYSKPLKCGYDPYTATWEEWSRHPMKQKAIVFYGLENLSSAGRYPA
ncbi:grasp-with-spasm system SPASM domain peptide maturase [Paraflavisolibacter sp. H34]|uniref:grasp-with-spasm system SPASM domain peptide maturase n=1 Tax=Huijunlia imazamoxiresistens TaxID=3127457 RepID=UPI003015F6A2